jgi:hypothetical protein
LDPKRKWCEAGKDCMRSFVTCTLRVTKSRRMRWAGHVACTEMRNAYRTVVEKPEKNRSLGDLDVDGRIILEWILWPRWEAVDWIHLVEGRDQ